MTRADAEQRLLVFAPTGRDAALTVSLLAGAGMIGEGCGSIEEVCDRVEHEGAACVMLAEEVLVPRALACLGRLLERQPAWSDLPILVFSSPDGPLRRRIGDLVAGLGNVTLLDRPVRPITMLSNARAAVRARRRQYVARDALDGERLAVRRRDEFLAMLGHELRNPLSAILLALEVLERGGDTGRFRGILRRQANHLARLVDDLLDVSRVTSGKITLQRAPLDLAELVQRCVQALDVSIRSQRLAVDVVTPASPVIVDGDPVRLEQVAVNLIANAIKYTPAGGNLRVEVGVDGDDAVLRVADDGVGIAPEMLGRIFDLFAQIDSTLDRAKGGLGIGLTLVRSLVELHHGTIVASSAGAGRGSEFVVRLPRLRADVPVSRGGAAPAARPGHRVLLIEDNVDTRDALRAALEQLGCVVDAVGDGPSALDRADAPDVMIVDIGLPGIDGYEVARRIRARRGAAVRLIALTGYGQPDDRRRAFEAGFDAHVTKPVDLRALIRLLDSHP